MMKTPSCVRSQADAFFKDSLHSVYRSKLERQIDEGNQVLPP
jgi:hypothetical protein